MHASGVMETTTFLASTRWGEAAWLDDVMGRAHGPKIVRLATSLLFVYERLHNKPFRNLYFTSLGGLDQSEEDDDNAITSGNTARSCTCKLGARVVQGGRVFSPRRERLGRCLNSASEGNSQRFPFVHSYNNDSRGLRVYL